MFENAKTFSMEFAGRPLVVETGKLAQLASGECMIRYGETAVHCVATISDKPRAVSYTHLDVYKRQHNHNRYIRQTSE